MCTAPRWGLNHEVAVVVLNPQAAEAWGMLLQVGKPGASVPMKFKRAHDFPATNDQAFLKKWSVASVSWAKFCVFSVASLFTVRV